MESTLFELDAMSTKCISDCFLTSKKDARGNNRNVFFYVPIDASSLSYFEEQLREILSLNHEIDFVVPITSIPYDENGLVDEDLLRKIPVFDQQAIDRNMDNNSKFASTAKSIAILTKTQFHSELFHLDDLLLGERLSIIEEQNESLSIQKKQDVLRPVALSEGGDLHIPKNMPLTLTQSLLDATKKAPDTRIVSIRKGLVTDFTYKQLLDKASRMLAGLRTHKIEPATPIVFQFNDNAEFLSGFWACILGGFIPVPMAVIADYTNDHAAIDNLKRVCKMLGSAHIFTSTDLYEDIRKLNWSSSLPTLTVLDINTLQSDPQDFDYYHAEPDETTLIMLTSGTTGAAKGVPLSHKNLICRSISSVQINGFNQDTISLNWMPLDHVAGIIYFHLRDVYLACEQIHLATSDIIENPLLWLDLLASYKASVTFAPNFAFGLLAGLSKEISSGCWDLSKLKLVLNGGEAVVASTARKFIHMLAPHGLSKHAMCPAWGMSETSSGVTYARDFELDNTSDLDPHVSVGRPIPGNAMRIVDNDNNLLREGEIGRLHIRGNTVFSGYYNNPDESSKAFSSDAWFITGDLGLLENGKLTITGREKDVIIVNGVNYSGPSIESVVEDIDGIVRSCVAACAIKDPKHNGKECLAIFFAYSSPTLTSDLLKKIKGTVTSKIGVSPEYLIPLPQEAIPKTSIGKIQHAKLKIAFEKNDFIEQTKQSDILLGKRCIPKCFFKPSWRHAASTHLTTNTSNASVVVFVDESDECNQLLQTFNKEAIRYVAIPIADIANPAPKHIGPNSSNDYHALFESLELPDIDHILFICWHSFSLSQNIEAPSNVFERAIISCVSAISQSSTLAPKSLLVLTDRARAVNKSHTINLLQAGVATTIKSLKQEFPNVDCDLIDMDFSENSFATNVCSELAIATGSKEIAWRENTRYQFGLKPFHPKVIEHDPLNQQTSSAFIVTGGLGGVGQIICEALLSNPSAYVLILGRRPIETLRDVQGNEKLFSQSYKQLTYASVDISDESLLTREVDNWLSKIAIPLTGIFHLAGAYEELALKNAPIEHFVKVCEAKVKGALSLSKVIFKHRDAYLVNFSSTASIFGGAQIGAYAAANSLLDAISHNLRAQGLLCTNINWSSWQGTGMSENNLAIDALRTKGILELSVESAMAALRIALGQTENDQLLIGIDPDNLGIRQATWATEALASPSIFSIEKPSHLSSKVNFEDDFSLPKEVTVHFLDVFPKNENGEIDRAALEIIVEQGNLKIVKPTTETQSKVLDVWKRVLQLDTLSLDWNFFDIGGESILATKLIASIRQQFSIDWTLKDIFSLPTCEDQAARIDETLAKSSHSAYSELPEQSIPVLPRTSHLPISSAQRRLWLLDELDIPSSVYNVTACVRFEQKPDASIVETCLNSIVTSQESLRSVFSSIGGVPQLNIVQDMRLELRIAQTRNAAETNKILVEEGSYHFSLHQGPLIRAKLIEESNTQYVLALTIHHIISDGWSVRVLFEQFESLYLGAKPEQSNAPKVGYVDYCAWQQAKIDNGDYDHQLLFWQKQLAGGLTGFDIPTDYPRPNIQTYNGARLEQKIPASLSSEIQDFASRQKLTHFVVLLSVFKTLLFRYSQNSDVSIGTVVANRDYAETEQLIGFFVNPVVVRSQVESSETFETLLNQVNTTLLEAVANHNIPFEHLIEKLAPPRDTSRSPLFQIAFDFRDPNLTSSQSDQLRFSVMEADLGTSKYDLHLTFEWRGNDLIALWEYNTDLFAAETITCMAENYQRLLESAINSKTTKLQNLPLISPAQHERQQRWNETQAPFNDQLCMHHLFERIAKLHPHRNAIVFKTQVVSYDTLNKRANKLARLLIAKGVKSNDVVAICLDKSIETIVTILAILKSGAGYLALDPSYPQQRLTFMLEDSGAKLLLTRADTQEQFAHTTSIKLIIETLESQASTNSTENLNIDLTPNHLAYMIYTSGSTGQPKGVLLEHNGWCNVAQAQIDSFGLQSEMRILQFASISFDASAFEFAMAWGSGGTLVMGSKEELMPGVELANLLRKHKVEVVTLPPTALNAMQDTHFPDLKVITVAGEACPEQLVKKWSNKRRFFNLYGPTETTIWASYAECFAQDKGSPRIGYPVANTQLYVVDQYINKLPCGMPGELCISGIGLARGYHNRDTLNQERFVANPFSPQHESRLYKTGDLVKQHHDGSIEFLGRIDHQVKIRAHRIELGEIESLLYKLEDISTAVVVAHQTDKGETQLMAYASASDTSYSREKAIRDYLKTKLSDFMIPTHIFLLEQLPLSVNGKVDRKSLPSPESLLRLRASVSESAHSEMEKTVSSIWKDVLGLENIDVNHNFFDIGGHSLKMAEVQTRLKEQLKRDIALVDLFQYTTIKTLAKYLSVNHEDTNTSQKIEPSAITQQSLKKTSAKDRMAKMAALRKRQGR